MMALIYLFIYFFGFTTTGNVKPKKWIVISGSTLKVDGSTNVNDFTCDITNYIKGDTIWVVPSTTQGIKLNGYIQLDVHNFNCHNPVMTADLRKTLKYKEHPKLYIRFLSMTKYPDATPGQNITKGNVIIELAGVTKRFDVDYKIVTAQHNYINLVGIRNVNFSDFNIVPPRKLGGMIKTNNELNVVFNLRIKVID